MIRVSLIAAFIITVQLCSAKGVNYQIKWNADTALSWNDFKGRANGASPYEALTFGGISYSFSMTADNKSTLFLNVYFDMKKSWLKKGKGTPELLKHEQAHFDIIELYARIFVKRIEENDDLNSRNLSKFIEKLFAKLNKEMRDFQLKYDKETDHSKNRAKQLEWNTKIQAMLIAHEKFDKLKIEIN